MKTRIATLFTLIILFVMFAVSMPVHAHFHTDTGWKITNEPERAIFVQDEIKEYSTDDVEIHLHVSLVVYCRGGIAIEIEGYITQHYYSYDLRFDNETSLPIRFDDERDISIEVERESDTLLYIHNLSKFHRYLNNYDELRIWLSLYYMNHNIMARFDISGYEQAYRSHCG